MKKIFMTILLARLVAAVSLTASAADVTEAELMQAATALARQYDAADLDFTFYARSGRTFHISPLT